jgi:hypothetical protein
VLRGPGSDQLGLSPDDFDPDAIQPASAGNFIRACLFYLHCLIVGEDPPKIEPPPPPPPVEAPIAPPGPRPPPKK